VGGGSRTVHKQILLLFLAINLLLPKLPDELLGFEPFLQIAQSPD
jgi:hypothetical protein